jgi:hypothetical protein
MNEKYVRGGQAGTLTHEFKLFGDHETRGEKIEM